MLVLCKMLINYINKSMKGSQMKYRITLNSFGESTKVASGLMYLFYGNVQTCKKVLSWMYVNMYRYNFMFELR